MGSFSDLKFHLVFGTQYRKPVIHDSFATRLHSYMGGILSNLKGHPIEIGGIEDHVHLLFRLPPTLAVASVIRDVKANASQWINEERLTRGKFKWQRGYAVFSVSHSLVNVVQQYIQTQREHHRSMTFKTEYLSLLDRHGIEYDPRYVFEEEYAG